MTKPNLYTSCPGCGLPRWASELRLRFPIECFRCGADLDRELTPWINLDEEVDAATAQALVQAQRVRAQASPVLAQARPRPRLAWDLEPGGLRGCSLRLNRTPLGECRDDGTYWCAADVTLLEEATRHTTLRDAATRLRLHFLALGFDVEAVPASLLNFDTDEVSDG